MEFFYPAGKSKEKITEDIIYSLLTLYKEENIKVQFKFKNKPNYVFEGEIL